jgi:hypothetical protein
MARGTDIAGALAVGLGTYAQLKLGEREKEEARRLRRQEKIEALQQALAIRNAQMDPVTRVEQRSNAAEKKEPVQEMAVTGYDELSADDTGKVSRRFNKISEQPNVWTQTGVKIDTGGGRGVQTTEEKDLAGRIRTRAEEFKPREKMRSVTVDENGMRVQKLIGEYGTEGDELGRGPRVVAGEGRGRTETDRIAAEERAADERARRAEASDMRKRKLAADQRALAELTELTEGKDREANLQKWGVTDDDALFEKLRERAYKRLGYTPPSPDKPAEKAESSDVQADT